MAHYVEHHHTQGAYPAQRHHPDQAEYQKLMSYILIAEDDRGILLLIERKLNMSGYSKVWTTPDRNEALQQALSNPPRLMILDIMLKNGSGLDVCTEVKQRLGQDAPPIILMSARGQLHEIEAGQAAGADAYLVKPFTPSELISEVETLIG